MQEVDVRTDKTVCSIGQTIVHSALRLFYITLAFMFIIAIFSTFDNPSISATPENMTAESVVNGSTTTMDEGPASEAIAQGGNISEINMTLNSQTRRWQGFYGHLQDNLSLRDASGNVFYNWSEENVTAGEVYFSNNSFVAWGNNIRNTSDDDVGNAQMWYNWSNSTKVDNLTNTYRRAHGHQEFNITDIGQINQSTSASVNLQDGTFNATMMWDDDTNQPLWAALVVDNGIAFDGREADFEILLPVRDRDAIESFYVYVELETDV